MAVYEFTAFTETELMSGGSDSNLSVGDTFTMPAVADATMFVTDNDKYLSGDSKRNDNSDDRSYQTAEIVNEDGAEIGNGGQIYAELYFWVQDQNGNWYVMIEIEQEGGHEDYFTFYTGGSFDMPPDGAVLTIHSQCSVTSDWIKYVTLDAGDVEPEFGWIKGRLTFDADGNDNEWNGDNGSWDQGVDGQTVQLLDMDGNVVAESVTDSYGNYSFDVPAGDYRVKFPLLEGYEFSEQDSGVAEHYDSDADASGLTDVITVAGGQAVHNIDAGLKSAPPPVPENLAPDAVDDAITVSASEGAGDIDGNVLDNDVDPDGDALTVVEVNGATSAVAQTVSGSNGGQVTINADGSFDFSADGDFATLKRGETATTSFEYSISDGSSNSAVTKHNIVFVIDISGSTSPAEFEGTPVGDQNGDGVSNSVLDAEIAAYKALSDKIAEANLGDDNVDIGLVIFSGNSGHNQSGASQIVGTFKPGSSSLDAALQSLTDGGMTNFEAPMQQTVDWFGDVGAAATDKNVVYFLSDGMQNVGGDWTDEVAQLEGQYNASIVAVGVGENAVLTQLDTIDNTGGAEIVTNTDDLEAALVDGIDFDNSADDTATLTVTVVGENHGPEAADDVVTINEDGSIGTGEAVQLNLTANDGDFDGDALTVTDAGGASAGSPFAVTTAGGVTVQITVDASGNVSFDTNGQFDGLIDGETDSLSFQYTVSDGFGGTATATATINIDGEGNPLPPEANDDSYTVFASEGAGDTEGNVLDNDTDPDGDELTVVEVNGAGGNVGQIVAGSNGGLATINADGSIDFDANGDFDGLRRGETAETTIEYSITDGNNGGDAVKQNIIFVVDVSGSTSPSQFEGTAVGDQNGDGIENSILDAEIASYKALSAEIASKGLDPNTVDIGLIIFSGNSGSNQNGASQIVGTFKPGSTGLDAALNGLSEGGYTNFEAPLQKSIDWFAGVNATAADNNVVYFLSDGMQNRGGAWENEVAQLETSYDASIVAIGVGQNAVLSQLNTVDNTGGAEIVTSTDGLTAALIDAGVLDDTADDSATVTVTVVGENHGPAAEDDAVTINEDEAVGDSGAVQLNILANDSDYDGDALTVTSAGGAAAGDDFTVTTVGGVTVQLTVDASGNVSFDTDGKFDGLTEGETDSFSFEYTADDGFGGTATATASITINGLNNAPEATDDTATTDEATSVSGNVLTNDSDPNGDALTVSAVSSGDVGVATTVSTDSGAFEGELTVNADGSYTFVPGGDLASLPVGATETVTVTYTADDGNGGTDTATLTITIEGVNEGPDASDDIATTDEATSVSGNVLTNDSDPNGDALTVSAVSSGDVGVATTVSTDSGAFEGELTVNADGSYTFVPGGDLASLPVGATETVTITYTADDGNGGTDTATLTITIEGVNEGPVAVSDAIEIDEDGAIAPGSTQSLNILDNDTDANGDSLSVSSVVGGLVGAAFLATTAGGTEVEVTVDENGDVSFDTAGLFDTLAAGETDSFQLTYTVSDGNGGDDTSTVTITINGLNEAPTAVNDASVTDEATAVSGNVLTNDSDPNGDALTVSAVSSGDVGVATTVSTDSGAFEGELTVNADGSYTFVPGGDLASLPVGATETVTVTYTADDGNGGTDTATLTITIEGVNEGPVAADDTGVTDEETAVSGDLLANDSDSNGDDLTITAVSFGAVGAVATVASANGLEGELIVNDDGTYTFTPGAGFEALPAGAVETVSFSYTVSDGNGGTDTANVVITVNGLNDAPVAGPDAITITEDDRISTGPLPDGASGELFEYNVLANDSDPDGDALSITSVFGADPAVGVSAGTPISVMSAGNIPVDVTMAANGQVTFLTNGQFDSLPVGQSDTVTVNYTISDGQGGTSTTSLVITIDGVNEGPQGVNESVTIGEDGQIGSGEAVTLNVLSNDTDPNGDELSVLSVNGQPAGTPFTAVTDNGVSVQVTVSANGELSFDTAGLFDDLNDGESDAVDFSYVLDDGNGGFDTADVTINITGSGQPSGPQESLNIVFTVDASAENVLAGSAGNFFAGIAGSSDIDGDGNAASLLDAQLYSIQAINAQYAADGITDGEISIVVSGNGAQLLADPVSGSTVFSVGDNLLSAFQTIDFSGYTGTAQLDGALTSAFSAISDLTANDTANGESRLIVMTDDTLNFANPFGLFTLGSTVAGLAGSLNTSLDADVLIFDSTATNLSLLSAFIEGSAGGDGTADQIVTVNDLDTFLGTISDDLIN